MEKAKTNTSTKSAKLYDSELKVMEVIWENEIISARKISDILAEKVGWNKNTTYTVIKRCIVKGLIVRNEPGFMCGALITKDDTRDYEIDELADKLFDGSFSFMMQKVIERGEFRGESIK